MANLLYPVDMSSLSRPNNDTKFRDLIMVLQQQMGNSPTGILTIDQFDRLEKASRNIDGDLIGVPPERQVFMSEDGRWASASGVIDGALPKGSVPSEFFATGREGSVNGT